MRTAFAALLLFFLAGCTKEKPPAPVDAGSAALTTDAAVGPSILGADDARAIVKGACLSCHSEEMLAQQRLTAAQWTKVVTKMVGWGANLDAKDTAPLTDWLAATYGPDAGPYDPVPVSAAEAAGELAAMPDGPLAGGDPERGRALFTDKCSACHGPEARGGVGILLVERPILYRAADVADTVRRGRGKMTPLPLTDAEIADVLAHLRRLKNP